MAKKAVPSGTAWLDQIFGAQAVQNGGVVRRSVADVKKYSSSATLKFEIRRRKFHLIRTGDQYVILCHTGDLRVLC